MPHGNLIKHLFPNSPASLCHKYSVVLAPSFFISRHVCIKTGLVLLRIYLSLLFTACLKILRAPCDVAHDGVTAVHRQQRLKRRVSVLWLLLLHLSNLAIKASTHTHTHASKQIP